MDYDFDHPPDRRGSDSVKWGRYAGRDVLPLWVADMDFAVAPPVVEALRRRVDHGVFGYADAWPSLVDAVLNYLVSEFEWTVDPSWIVWLPGLVTGLNVACRAVDGAAFTATPVYPPFLSAAQRLTTAPLSFAGTRWLWDLAAVEEAMTPDCKLFLLCHPHNPVGRAWETAELLAIDEIAQRRGLVVCSDEIHSGLILEPGRRHKPYATISTGAQKRSITLMSPSKTFNLPGLGCAFALIPDEALRRSFRRAMDGVVPHVNVLGLVACEAAFRNGADWHEALLDYLRGNRERVFAVVKGMPGIQMANVEATYLAWIDTTGSGLANARQAFEAAGVGLSGGRPFGPKDLYASYVRLNFGCSRAVLDEALDRMSRALRG